MLQLEFEGRTVSIPDGDSMLGSDPSGLVSLVGAQPRHLALKGASDGTVSVQPQGGAEVLLNGVKLGNDPHPVLHGDKLMIVGKELLVVDPKRSGSTQYVNANDLANMVATAKKSGPSSAGMVNGRLVSLTDGREYAIAGERATIGRDAECDVVIESKSVSRKHAEIMTSPKGYVLVDLSTNGTYVNGEKVPGQRVLARADVIRVGDADLRFYADPPKGGGQPVAAAPAAPATPARAAETSPPPQKPAASTPGQAPRATVPTPAAPAPPQAPPPLPAAAARLNDTMHGTPAAAVPPGPLASILVRTGSKKGQRLPIRVPVVNIGRAEFNDIVIPEESVSTQHAKLQRRDGVWYIIDVGSTNGTFVDGDRITEEMPISAGTAIRFGDASVVFENADDALGLQKAGGAGTKVMGALKVDPPTPAPKAAPAAPVVEAPKPAPAARGAEPAPPRPAVARPAAKSAAKSAPKPADGGAPKWLIPVIILIVVIAAVAFFLLK